MSDDEHEVPGSPRMFPKRRAVARVIVSSLSLRCVADASDSHEDAAHTDGTVSPGMLGR